MSEEELLKEELLCRGIQAIFRFKSRRIAMSFSNWKYQAKLLSVMPRRRDTSVSPISIGDCSNENVNESSDDE